jgi:uncharacterized membrane protein
MTIQKPKAVLFGVGISAFCCVFAVGLFWILQSDWNSQVQQLHSNQQLIVLSYSSGYIPGVLAGLMVIALLFTGLTFLLFAGTNTQRFKPAFIRFCTLAVLLSLAGVFVGEMLIANKWDRQAQQKGYLPCPVGTLLSNRLTYTAWVQNEALCYNSDIRRIISRGTPEETKQVEQYWQAQQRQLETRLKLQQG